MRSHRTKLCVLLFTALVTLFSPAVDHAQIARMDVIPFESLTLTDQDFLRGGEDGKHVTIAGELRLPRSGGGRLPAVILLHPSGGISGALADWETYLLSMGVATFVVDSFTGRGIVNTINDQSQLGRLAQIEDAYRALALLAKDPRIDSNRVMLMGFSRGGQGALYASMVRFQKMHANPALPGFAAYVAFYPDCSVRFRDDEDVAAVPIRILHGSADNYVPVAPCNAYVDRLQAKGKDARIIVYPGANHIFDGRALKNPVVLPQAQTMRNCAWEEHEAGQLVNVTTKQSFSYDDPCVERGAVIGYDQNAAEQARTVVGELVTTILKPARSP
jgi:dienelactone hydrolase